MAAAYGTPCHCGQVHCGGDARESGHEFGELLLCVHCGIACSEFHGDPQPCNGSVEGALSSKAQTNICALEWQERTRMTWPVQIGGWDNYEMWPLGDVPAKFKHIVRQREEAA